MESAECMLKMFGLGNMFGTMCERSEQRLAIANWIHTNLKESLHRYGTVSITPVMPRQGQAYVILSFPSSNDARHFKGAVSRRRNCKEKNDKIFTSRWAINSSSLMAGDDDTISYIQGEIVNAYNEQMDDAELECKLQLHHVSLIIIGTLQRFIKGKVHVLFDFIDPCDRVTSLLWYEDQGIPNPRTHEKAKTNPEYAQLTLREHGLWTTKARLV